MSSRAPASSAPLQHAERRIIVNDFLESNVAVLRACSARPSAIGARSSGDRHLQSSRRRCTLLPRELRRPVLHRRDGVADRRRARRDRPARAPPVVKCAAIASLLYAADASALTCGTSMRIAGSWTAPAHSSCVPAIRTARIAATRSTARTAIAWRAIEADLIYIDPPYNPQYGTLYHVSENIASNRKPALVGKTRKISCATGRRARIRRRGRDALRDLVRRCRAAIYPLVQQHAVGCRHVERARRAREIERILADGAA